jgi:hypothetical protein
MSCKEIGHLSSLGGTEIFSDLGPPPAALVQLSDPSLELKDPNLELNG